MTHYRRALEQARPLGPDRTPLVVRVLLGLAIVAMVTLIVVGAYVGLALLLAKAHSGVR